MVGINGAAGLGAPHLSEVLLLHKAIDLGAQPRVDGGHLLLSQAHCEPLPLSQPSFPQPATLQDKLDSSAILPYCSSAWSCHVSLLFSSVLDKSVQKSPVVLML